MTMRTWLAITTAACASAAAPTAPANHADRTTIAAIKTVNVPPFGDIAVEDGALELMDHNSGDERVHVLTVSRDSHGSKMSWADRPGARSDVKTGAVPISAEERDQIRSWSEQLWQLAPGGRRAFPKAPPDGKPAYEWAIMVRRGDEVRVIEGGASTGPDTQPDIIEGVVDFLDMHF